MSDLFQDSKYNHRLAYYLLNYNEKDGAEINAKGGDVGTNPATLTNSQLLEEINKIVLKIKPFQQAGLSGYKHFMQSGEKIVDAREHKHDMLEEHEVYDKHIASVVREFCIITIALLGKLEKIHKKGILAGNINPYNFMYSSRFRQCEPCDLTVILSEAQQVKSEKQLHGDLMYVHANLYQIEDNKYLAPEIKQAMKVFSLQRMLKNFKYVADSRGLTVDRADEIQNILREFHREKVIYSNKAEIYSVGYTVNQILSHLLEKLAILGLTILQPAPENVDPKIIAEADTLLPDTYANPHKERILTLLNECISCIHDLMNEHVEKRDSLAESIVKFRSILKRITIIKPDDVMDEDEAEEEENELKTEIIEQEKAEEIEEQEAEEAEEEQEEFDLEDKEGDEEEVEREEHEEHEEHEEEGEEQEEMEEQEEKEEEEKEEEEKEQEEKEEEEREELESEELESEELEREEAEHEDAEHEEAEYEEEREHEANEADEEHEESEEHEGHESHEGHGHDGPEHEHESHDSAGHEHGHGNAHDDNEPGHTSHGEDHSDLDVAHDHGASRTPGTTGYKPTTMMPRR